MDVVLFGAGGHAKVTIDIMLANGHTVRSILDDDVRTHGSRILGIPVIGGKDKFSELIQNGLTNMFVTIGSNRVRLMISRLAREAGFNMINAIHPTAIVSPNSYIGSGVFLAPGSIVCASAFIGDAVIINTGASVDHDCHIEDGAHICPGVHLAGNVLVGKETQVGIGSSVIQGKIIGEKTLIGAGSVVVRDIPSHATAYGNPARVVKQEVALKV